MAQDKFYVDTIRRLLDAGEIDREMSVLVLCGTQLDAEVFESLGFETVTVSNLDERHEGTWDTGARWVRENAEALTCPDRAYDFVAVHLGLHHCRQPHQALCEMYRVARVGVLVIEPCENMLVNLGRKLGVGQEYEVHAVASNGLESGGVNNSPIPNYVYRWTAGEVRQTICSFAPEFRHKFKFRNHLVVHWHDLRAKKKKGRLLLMLILFPWLKLCSVIFPGFGNNIGFFIPVADHSCLQPWLERDGSELRPDAAWFAERLLLEK
jgi:SAM-dependent methyltransferase